MRLLQLKLCRILAGDDALAVLYITRQAVQKRCLAGAGTAGNEDVAAHASDDLENLGALRRRSSRTGPAGQGSAFSFLNLRIVSVGPSIAREVRSRLTREPSPRRASQIGLDSSTRRPTWLTMRWQI